MIEIDYPEEEHREATSGQTTLLQVLEKKILSGPYQTELKTSIFETMKISGSNPWEHDLARRWTKRKRGKRARRPAWRASGANGG